MDFEFDPAKSEANLLKHGVDFIEAQGLWDDLDRIEVPARTTDEDRWLVIAKFRDAIWAAVVTYRQGRIRIISVRRARQSEEHLYESS
ncbi:MAG: hypothetical protein AMXMBFR81_13950 [Chthonomonas sp.]